MRRNYAGAEKRMFDGSRHIGTFHYGPRQEVAPVELPRMPTLAQIHALEDVLFSGPTIDMDPNTSHHFADGLYGRELFIPAGTILTGKMHRGRHLNVLAQGDITVWTEDGMKRLQAPAVIVSEPGTKRVGYAHTDTVWITIHASEETDLAALEAELIVPEPKRQLTATPALTTDGE